MAEGIASFLVGLAKDPKALASFHANPAAAVKAAGLPQEQAQALISKNAAAIQSAVLADRVGLGALGKSGAADADVTVVVVIT